MPSLPQTWSPLPVSALPAELAGFDRWVLCGGYSVAILTGADTRSHGDTDIGVFRSDLENCLRVLGLSRVYLCRSGTHVAWDGGKVAPEVHDIWVTSRDGRFWSLQVMVFDDDGDDVVYRRDPRLRWPKRVHSRIIDGIPVLNPFVTFLFKANKTKQETKELHDLRRLIELGGK